MSIEELFEKLKDKTCASCVNRAHTKKSDFCELRHDARTKNHKLVVTTKTAACFQYEKK